LMNVIIKLGWCCWVSFGVKSFRNAFEADFGSFVRGQSTNLDILSEHINGFAEEATSRASIFESKVKRDQSRLGGELRPSQMILSDFGDLVSGYLRSLGDPTASVAHVAAALPQYVHVEFLPARRLSRFVD
jgi:hypothetical protein